MNKIAIIQINNSSADLAQTISFEYPNSEIIELKSLKISTKEWFRTNFHQYDAFVFISAVGIALRYIAPYIEDKHSDPAVVCVDSTGAFAIALLSGHIGGGNTLTEEIARIIGAEPVITTQSDRKEIWALDLLAQKWGWKESYLEHSAKGNNQNKSLNNAIFTFVNNKPVALLLDVKDKGTAYLERSKPENVDIFYSYSDIDQSNYELIIAVTYRYYPSTSCDILYYFAPVLHMGFGCRKDTPSEGAVSKITSFLKDNQIAVESISSISTIEQKKDEALLQNLKEAFEASVNIYSAEELSNIDVPNPSEKALEAVGCSSVSEAAAILASNRSELIITKQKCNLDSGPTFTFALAADKWALCQGHIEIVGAGPGDPELVSVRGKKFLQNADLILYAGSLVPIELTYYAKEGAVVRSSASLNLEEQFEIMREFYEKGKLVVRLHTGDPCIYGAIQEQMAYFDKYNYSYHITPGISSFLAAAAELRSQFTIPEKVQTIILTRGEGRTPMPEKEKLDLLARSQSTMCIFLSASIVDQVQKDLLVHYPPTTPVAACYKLTWKDQKIYRGKLEDLSKIVKENNLTLTTMIVVGESIDNRAGLSKLYADEFKHIFRK